VYSLRVFTEGLHPVQLPLKRVPFFPLLLNSVIKVALGRIFSCAPFLPVSIETQLLFLIRIRHFSFNFPHQRELGSEEGTLTRGEWCAFWLMREFLYWQLSEVDLPPWRSLSLRQIAFFRIGSRYVFSRSFLFDCTPLSSQTKVIGQSLAS